MARILIMEDDSDFREMLREMLEVNGYEVEEAPDGEVGVKLYQSEPSDLTIIDIFMPHKDGLEAIRKLKKDYPDVKVIAISGGGKTGALNYLDYASDFGAQKILAKPFDRREILEAVDELLGERG